MIDSKAPQGHLEFCTPLELHGRIVGAATTFGRYPLDVLGGVFNVTGFTVNTILRINL